MRKIKEPVRLRQKRLANGNVSLYLDIYIDGVRHYEFLKLYLINARTQAEKVQNQNTMALANAVKAKRVLEVASGKAQFSIIDKKKTFTEYLSAHVIQKRSQEHAVLELLKEFGKDIKLCNMNLDFVLSFQAKLKSLGRYSEMTIAKYCRCLRRYVVMAQKEGYFARNPYDIMEEKDKVKDPNSNRTYLTIEELKTIMEANIDNEVQRRDLNVFLFACFCGLRISDIKRLRWENIVTMPNGRKQIEITMKKTKQPLFVPLSDAALQYIPQRTSIDDTSLVFDLPHKDRVNDNVKAALKSLGITRKVSFHCSRHTFATMMLTLGADIYTTSKLLGHRDISSTQIYAKIVDKKKEDAVNLCNEVFIKKA